MTRLMFPVILAAVTGCYTEKKYTTDRAETNCSLYEDCEYLDQVQYEDTEECVYYEELLYDFEDISKYPSGCDFDREQAITCIEGIRQNMTCEDLESGNFPVSCELVCDKNN